MGCWSCQQSDSERARDKEAPKNDASPVPYLYPAQCVDIVERLQRKARGVAAVSPKRELDKRIVALRHTRQGSDRPRVCTERGPAAHAHVIGIRQEVTRAKAVSGGPCAACAGILFPRLVAQPKLAGEALPLRAPASLCLLPAPAPLPFAAPV